GRHKRASLTRGRADAAAAHARVEASPGEDRIDRQHRSPPLRRSVMAPRGSIFLSVVLVACGVSRAPSPSPARPPSPSPAAAEAPAESPAPAAAFLFEPGPAIWTAARAARDGAFPLPSGLTGDDAADEVLAGTPVREATIGYYAD